MELLFELLLTAAATLLVAFLLAKLFSGTNDPRRDRAAGPADVIAEEKAVEAEEERIIEVDEVKAKAAWADVAAPALAEGWVEVEKAPATVAERMTEWVAAEEGVPATLAPELFLGTVSQEQKEEGEVGKKQCDLTAAAEAAVEARPRDSCAEAAPREVLDVELEEETTQQHDLGAVVAPSEVPDAGLQKQEVQAVEAVEVKQLHLDVGAAPAEVIDAGLEEEVEEEGAQAAEVIPRELASETLPADVLDVVTGKQEEQVIEANQNELAPVVAPRVIPDAAAKDEEMKEQSVEEVVEVQNKEEAQCEASTVDQQEKLVPREELVLKKADDLNVSQEDSPNDKVDVQLPEKDTTLLGMPEDEARASMEFEEWEGIERSEVEKRFGAAAAFAASDVGTAALSKLNSDVQLQLQGLLKVAVDGPCYDAAQPLTLRPSSRAKWVSWQKLGNMHPEIAMEKYMNLLSEFIPGWMGDTTPSIEKHGVHVDSEGALLTMTTHTSDPQINQGNEGSTSIDEGPLTGPPNPEKGLSSVVPAE